MKSIVYIIFALSLLSVCACGGADNARQQAETRQREDSAALKVGVLPTEDCLPVILAGRMRLYDTLGVSVRLKYYKALSECGRALKDSLVEGAVIDSTLMAWLNGQGVGLSSELRTDMHWQLLTAKKARISRLSQLVDKIIAADSHGESHRLAELAIDSLTRKGQLVFIVQVEDLGVRLSMLNTGNVDAAMLPEPYASKARKAGARVIGQVKSRPAGVVAFREKAMRSETRQKQLELFKKAVAMAKDSISINGLSHYKELMDMKYLEIYRK
ncbi:MAG: ABC transporter substrate-binding protein [Prevotellaceae bacterium]|nr:ABC transporter substrate-binding protein [Prevotellaceae bacterium]MDO4932184.1 ABC transporter substrate-binding protein [Prevotellaceae bacterium]